MLKITADLLPAATGAMYQPRLLNSGTGCRVTLTKNCSGASTRRTVLQPFFELRVQVACYFNKKTVLMPELCEPCSSFSLNFRYSLLRYFNKKTVLVPVLGEPCSSLSLNFRYRLPRYFNKKNCSGASTRKLFSSLSLNFRYRLLCDFNKKKLFWCQY
jgi:hypothetical protein